MSQNKEYNFSNEVGKLIQEIKEYLDLKYDITRLDIAEKVVVLFSFFYSFMVFIILIPGVFLFLSFALAYYLGLVFGGNHWGFVIVGGIYFIISIFFMIYRQKLIVKPLVKILSKMILNS
jgi:hypothetical protein